MVFLQDAPGPSLTVELFTQLVLASSQESASWT